MSDLHIHVIDDNLTEAKTFEDSWRHALTPIWPDLKFTYSDDFDDLDEIRLKRPHIVIVDNVQVVGEKELNNKGLDLISRIKNDCPDSVFILFTNASFTISSLGSRQPNPDLIVTKTVLPNSEYEAEISVSISKHLRRLPVGEIAVRDKATSDAIEGVFSELKSLVEQCLFTFLRHGSRVNASNEPSGNIPFERSSADQVFLKALTDGYSGAAVLNCEIHGTNAPSDTTQFVLKISDSKSISMEVGAYDTFVRLQIPHHLRVDLIGAGTAQNASAVFYAFAYGSSSEVQSMTQLLKDGDQTIMENLLKGLTSFGSTGWYTKAGGGTIPIEKYINSSEEYAPRKEPKRVQSIKGNFEKFFPRDAYEIDDESLSFRGNSYPTPRMLLKHFRGREVHTCICHGDLNSNNVIVLKDHNAVSVIDFEYTGKESIYKEFISLEYSLRLYFPAKVDISSFDVLVDYALAREREFASGSGKVILGVLPDWAGLAMEITKLRKHAISHWAENSIDFDPEMYLLLSALHTFKLMTFDIWSEEQFLRLFAHYVGSIAAISKN